MPRQRSTNLELDPAIGFYGSPRSPTKAEIEAIMSRVAPVAAAPTAVPDHVQRIRDATQAMMALGGRPG